MRGQRRGVATFGTSSICQRGCRNTRIGGAMERPPECAASWLCPARSAEQGRELCARRATAIVPRYSGVPGHHPPGAKGRPDD